MIGHFAMKFLVKGTPLRTCRCAVSHQASAGSAHNLHHTPHVLLEPKNHKHAIGRSKEVATWSMAGKHTSDIAVCSRYVLYNVVLAVNWSRCGKAKFLSCIASVDTAAED